MKDVCMMQGQEIAAVCSHNVSWHWRNHTLIQHGCKSLISISIHRHRLMFDSPETFSQYWYRSLFALCTYTDWSAMCGWNPKDIYSSEDICHQGTLVPSYPTRMFCNAHIHTYILYQYNMILYLCIRSSIDTSEIPDPDSGCLGPWQAYCITMMKTHISINSNMQRFPSHLLWAVLGEFFDFVISSSSGFLKIFKLNETSVLGFYTNLFQNEIPANSQFLKFCEEPAKDLWWR